MFLSLGEEKGLIVKDPSFCTKVSPICGIVGRYVIADCGNDLNALQSTKQTFTLTIFEALFMYDTMHT